MTESEHCLQMTEQARASIKNGRNKSETNLNNETVANIMMKCGDFKAIIKVISLHSINFLSILF